MPRLPSVIVFGGSGAGKSSVVNMLAGGPKADVSSGAGGVTFSATRYRKSVNGRSIDVYDTAGLNEAPKGTVSPRQALDQLFALTRQLSDGIDLLVFVMRAPRITTLVRQNYEMFHRILCRGQVPIVIVVTGLENEEDLGGWWQSNKSSFDSHDLLFNDHACITATRGLKGRYGYPFGALYADSQQRLQDLIENSIPTTPWYPPQQNWFKTTVQRSLNIWADVLGSDPVNIAPEFKQALASYGEVIDPQLLERGQAKPSRQPRFNEGPPNVVVFGPDADSVAGLMTRGALRKPSSPYDDFGLVKLEQFTVHLYRCSPNATSRYLPQSAPPIAHHIANLYSLSDDLAKNVHLLIYAIAGSQLSSLRSEDYEAIFDMFLDERCPIVLAVSQTKGDESRWAKDRRHFDENRMLFHGHIYLTAPNQTSRKELGQLILTAHSQASVITAPRKNLLTIIRSLFFSARVSQPPILTKALELVLSKEESQRASKAARKQTWP